MNRLNKELWSYDQILDSIPLNHPLYKYPSMEKLEIMALYLNDLKLRKHAHFEHYRNELSITYAYDYFQKRIKTLKASPSWSLDEKYNMRPTNFYKFGFPTRRTRKSEWIVDTLSRDGLLVVLYNRERHNYLIYAQHETLLLLYMRDILRFINGMGNDRMTFKTNTQSVVDLSSRLRAYREVRDKGLMLLQNLDTILKSPVERVKEFISQIPSDTKPYGALIENATRLLPLRWRVNSVTSKDFVVSYSELILASHIYKSDEFAERDIVTVLKQPYWLKDMYLLYGEDGKFQKAYAKGYHPNCNDVVQDRRPDLKINHSKHICSGDFDTKRLHINSYNPDNQVDINAYRNALSDFVLMLKTVNLGSAFWSPDETKFLDKYQEYLSDDKLPDSETNSGSLHIWDAYFALNMELDRVNIGGAEDIVIEALDSVSLQNLYDYLDAEGYYYNSQELFSIFNRINLIELTPIIYTAESIIRFANELRGQTILINLGITDENWNLISDAIVTGLIHDDVGVMINYINDGRDAPMPEVCESKIIEIWSNYFN